MHVKYFPDELFRVLNNSVTLANNSAKPVPSPVEKGGGFNG